MPRRPKRPSQYRFLFHLRWAAMAVFITIFGLVVQRIICGMVESVGQACGDRGFPAVFFWALAAVYAGSVVAAAYRGYRDFYCGDYIRDFHDPNWRDRW
jgi:hypothetical protein